MSYEDMKPDYLDEQMDVDEGQYRNQGPDIPTEEDNQEDSEPSPPGRSENGDKYRTRANEGSRNQSNSIPELSIETQNGGYGTWKQSGEDQYWEEWSNFILEYKSIVESPNGDKRMNFIVHPRRDYDDSYEITVDTEVFNDKRKFKREVCIGETTTWRGSNANLADLKEYVTQQDRTMKQGTHHMGLNNGLWVTPDGNIDEHGWTEESEILYENRDIATERMVDIPESYDDEEVADILEMLPQTRDPERFLPIMGYFYASSLKPLILDWEGEFNLLSVTGDSGAGKTATLSVLSEMFGMGSTPLAIKDGEFNEMIALSSSNSIPIWFDEYKPSDMADYKVDAFHDKLRKSTRPTTATRGNKDGSNDSFELDAPVVVSGEESITGSAEERRQIPTTLKEITTDRGTRTHRLFSELLGKSVVRDDEVEHYDGYDLSQHAIAWIRWILSKDEDYFRAQWQDSYKVARDVMAENEIALTEDMDIQGMRTIHFGCALYEDFAESLGAYRPFSTEDIEDAMTYPFTGGGTGENRESHVDTFFSVASRAANNGSLKRGSHYQVVDDELRINFSQSLDVLRKYGKEYDISEDLLGDAGDYYSRMRDGIGKYPYIKLQEGDVKGKDRVVGMSVRVDLEAAERHIERFHANHFRVATQGNDDEEFASNISVEEED